MSAAKLVCRVCGKEYEPCRSAVKASNVFHWQEVACSPECGAIYLARVNAARDGQTVTEAVTELGTAECECGEETAEDIWDEDAEDEELTDEDETI